jgi:uncharacterized protein YbaR (Trm112 family)
MFIELVDVLRCPQVHEESWLVLAATRVDDRAVVAGTLGCPVCHAEYPIVDGFVRFDGGRQRITSSGARPDEAEALRLAALLNLSDPRGYAVLVGANAIQGPLVATMTDVQLLLVDPPAGIGLGFGLSGLTSPADMPMLPLAPASARGIALDQAVTPELARAAVAILRPGGRLLAPAWLDVPPGLSELARDASAWVAERAAATVPSQVIRLERHR